MAANLCTHSSTRCFKNVNGSHVASREIGSMTYVTLGCFIISTAAALAFTLSLDQTTDKSVTSLPFVPAAAQAAAPQWVAGLD